MSVNLVLFNGYDTNDRANLWETDGTAAGTVEIAAAGARSTGLSPEFLTPYHGKALFNGFDANGSFDLWETDGTAAGTKVIPVTGSDPTIGLNPSNFTLYQGKVFFNGYDASGNQSLWETDGTASGTKEIPGLPSPSDFSSGYTVYKGKLLFGGYDANNKAGLWKTDGTAAGTKELVAGAGPYGLDPGGLTLYNGKVLFGGTDVFVTNPHTHGHLVRQTQLWITDGTASGTKKIPVAGADTSIGLRPFDLTAYHGKVFFGGYDSQGNNNLWMTDGTSAGTKEILVGGAGSGGLAPSGFTLYNGKLFFDGTDASGEAGLWVTDGTAAGTKELSVAGSDPDVGLNPQGFVLHGGKLLFAGYDDSNKVGLWETDGTASGTKELVAGANAPPLGLYPTDLAAATLDADPASEGAGGANTIVDSGTKDTITLTQANATLMLHGTDQIVFLSAPGANISDGGQGTSLELGSNPGQVTLPSFGSDAHGVVDLLSGLGGFTSASQVVAALQDDHNGGTLLSFGAAGSLDFAGVAPGALHAANFGILPSG
jgi:ELWxxDGT repeat protein